MGCSALSVFVAICLIAATYGTKCSAGPGYRFPITCPEKLDPAKSYCCEIEGSFLCCDEKEFLGQRIHRDNDDDKEPGVLRNKRNYLSDLRSYQTSYSYRASVNGLGVAAIIGIIIAAIFPFALCCCCCCCACCPCYHWCHRNSTNVTIIQPGTGAPAGYSQNNFNISVPTATQSGTSHVPMPVHQPPPQYSQEDFAKPSAAGWVQ